MPFKLKTSPSVEPLTVQEVRDHLCVDSTDDDALISELISVARQYIEESTRRPLITQSWTYYSDCFSGDIELKPNLQSVTTVKYIDTDGNQQTLSSENYSVDIASIIGTVYPAYSLAWPSARYTTNSIEIEFIAGYGLAAAVPAPIKQAALLLIGHFYQNRESVMVGVNAIDTPMAVDMLLGPYKVVTF